MECAEEVDIDGVSIRVVKADYLAVMALKVDRAKDKTRILALLESKSVTPEQIEVITVKHNLSQQWLKFKELFLNEP